ncbi:MAG: serine/threonine-protein kinase, partial [Myxococcales bacterium]
MHTRTNVTQQLEEPIQFGKYSLYERIGRGGMADVFKGRIQGPAGFERVFVVKRILPHLSDDPAFIRMFVEEAKMSARLNHPNIVQVFELGSVEGELFISMEYVSGHDLAQTMRALWKTSGPPRGDMVAYIGREMCRALDYAHGLTDEHGQLLGMIHRDVSPSNVMLSFEGAVKLLDFGIAKALGDAAPEVTKSGTLKGKYAYMAPEQTEDDDVDHRADIFAAGIVMHEVLTGRRLFKGQNDLQTIERVRRCEVRPPSQLNSSCPPMLDEIVLRALERDPNDRFQTAGEMADALDEVVHAAHFTPQLMAAALREAFGVNVGDAGIAPVGPGPVADRRFASSISNPTLSAVTGSNSRSPTVPPIALSRTRASASRMNTLSPGTDGFDGPAASALAPRPAWRRGSFWLVALLCAGGIGAGVGTSVWNKNRQSGSGVGTGANLAEASPALGDTRPPRSTKKPRLIPVLIQSDPEGADIFVAGRFESVGTTPRWVTLDLDPSVPTRVMVRKPGFQDKAIAVESDKPPVVQLIPIDADLASTVGSGRRQASGEGATSDTARDEKARR